MKNLSLSANEMSSRISFDPGSLAIIMRDYQLLTGARSTSLKCLIQHCESVDHSTYTTSFNGALHLLGYALNSCCEAFSVYLKTDHDTGSWHTLWCRTSTDVIEVPAITMAEASASELIYTMLCSLAIGTKDDKLAERLNAAGW